MGGRGAFFHALLRWRSNANAVSATVDSRQQRRSRSRSAAFRELTERFSAEPRSRRRAMALVLAKRPGYTPSKKV